MVITNHLESMCYNSKIRRAQANIVHQILGSHFNTILVGDLNTEDSLTSLSEFWEELPIENQHIWSLKQLHFEKEDVKKKM
ncbi:Hypothetical protein HVR_LOCUS763 [uncultured virus]|nr:Hypothetical protein HVR_LOCUS763 [uncultured virus]